MREIKFRAWLYDEKRFADLTQVDSDGDWRAFCEEDGIYSEYFPTDKDTLEQYTGLKDINGKEIYENMVLNNRYLVIKILTKHVLYDILNKDILDGGINADTIEITGEYQELSENQKGDIDEYLQQAKRKIKTKGLAFA